MTLLLDVHNLSISFAGKEVVHGISFSMAKGEKLAVVGESGSGKTITALSLLRLVMNAHVSGKALFNGRDTLSMSERDLRAIRGKDVAMIFQEPMTALNPLMTVGCQIAEVLVLKMAITPAQSALVAIELIAETGITEPQRCAQSYPHQLSGGQRQRAMIAMAVACQPQLLVADEPTTALDVSLRGRILELMARWQQKTGMAVLMITHDLNLVRRFADRIMVMEHGRIVEHNAQFDSPQHAYTRQLVGSQPQRHPETDTVLLGNTAPVMVAKGLRVSYPTKIPGWRGWFNKGEFVALQGLDFSLSAGQTLGIVGESGSGKSTLALAVLGLLPCQGQLTLHGQTWGDSAATNKALRRQIQVVFQDPFSSLSPRLTVEEIVEEGLEVHAPELSPAQRRQKVMAVLREAGLGEGDQMAQMLPCYPHEFSGGQRQRLAIARALIIDPRLLVLDEPTSALDVTVQQRILQLLGRLQRERGLSYLLITHDMAVIRAMAHHVLVMKDGVAVEYGTVQHIMTQPCHAQTRALVDDWQNVSAL